MSLIKFIASAGITLIVVLVLDTRMGGFPAAGKFLSPFHGFWQNAETGDPPADVTLRIGGLLEPVTVVYDQRRVPHIFAKNDRDLFFAQGYVTARDRLWQMEFQTAAAAGRLAEILGPAALERDRYQRRVGLVHGARNTLKVMMAAPETRLSVTAYTEGVNAYIGSLRGEDYPIEYKLLGYGPGPWTPLKCAILIKSMAWILSGRNSDLRMNNTLDRFGEGVVRDLFSSGSVGGDTVIPGETPWNFEPRKVIRPDTPFKRGSYGAETSAGIGSNNWAVSGTRTASGYPILANDPHLGLALPSLWYEVQLVNPTRNVYGVSLPGGPGVVIGFNRDIAWGLTNAGTDVSDWYEIAFKDDTLQEYRHGDAWRRVQSVVEEIMVRGGETFRDTVRYTHHGPIVWDSNYTPADSRVPERHAFRWVGHDGSNEWLTCQLLNNAREYDDFVEALSHLNAPAQNFAYADAQGNIAIWHNGKFPVRWEGQGVFIADGSDPLHDWQDWIPHAHKPRVKNPERGFVSSANQRPADPSYPYWLTKSYSSPTRARRINERLAEMTDITPDDFRALQLDTKHLRARSILPVLLAFIEPQSLSPGEAAIYQELKNWDYFADASKIAPTIFETWWRKLYRAIWKDEFSAPGPGLQLPSPDRTVKMILGEPHAGWFDDTGTETVETLSDLARGTFASTHIELTGRLGPMGEAWKWGHYKGADIRHLLRIPEFSRMNLFVGGGRDIVNATNRGHGPCWRMVVALGPEVRAWGIYPGGQSGNPGSRHYDTFVDTWARGELDELLFMRTPEDGGGRIQERLILINGQSGED